MSMFKSVKVNYPKKKTKASQVKVPGLAEPVRKTMYDIVVNNLQIAERKTFLQRTIYIGDHHFESEEVITNFFLYTVTQANAYKYGLDKLTGILFRYPKHFIHVLEGDEDSILEQIRLLLHNENYSSLLGNIKLLTNICHINCRCTNHWLCLCGIPPKLLEPIDPASSMELTGSYVQACILKIYAITELINKSDEQDSQDLTLKTISHSSTYTLKTATKVHLGNEDVSLEMSSLGSLLASRIIMPEVELISFLLNSEYLTKMSEYLSIYRHVPQRDIYKDKVWPIAADFIPYDIFCEQCVVTSPFSRYKPSRESIETDKEIDQLEGMLQEDDET